MSLSEMLAFDQAPSVLLEHASYLRDSNKIKAYERAIHDVVRPGDTVLDLGTGTALLGMMAARAGAKRVYAIDRSEMLELARTVVAENGFEEKFVFLQGHSTELSLPEQVDVIVCDQLEGTGIQAGLVASMHDAAARFLRPGGVLVPRSVRTWVAGARGPKPLSLTQEALQFDALARRLLNAPRHVSRVEVTTSPQLIHQTELGVAKNAHLDTTFSLESSSRGTGAFVLWFDAELAAGVQVTNSPLNDCSIDRRRVLLPLSCTFLGGTLPLRGRVQGDPQSGLMSWKAECGEITANGNSLHASLGSASYFDALRDDRMPKLSNKGHQALSLLQQMSEASSLKEIRTQLPPHLTEDETLRLLSALLHEYTE